MPRTWLRTLLTALRPATTRLFWYSSWFVSRNEALHDVGVTRGPVCAVCVTSGRPDRQRNAARKRQIASSTVVRRAVGAGGVSVEEHLSGEAADAQGVSGLAQAIVEGHSDD